MKTAAKLSWSFAEGQEIVPGRQAVQLLGGGTRAEAWLAWDALLHTLVVVKILRPDHAADEGARAALAREARVLADLQHPAIVRAFDAVLDSDRPHLVLESLDGPRLSTLLRRFGPLAAEQIVPLGLEISSALAYMHASGYVHLDVKPRNLIMGATPRLIDLGIARRVAELSRLSGPLGTDAYMAPEQCRVETLSLIGPAADVWGLGVTLYQAVSGRHPFKGAVPGQYPQLSVPAPALDSRVPTAIARLIQGCLAYDPTARPSAAAVGAALEPLLEDSRRSARRRLRARRR